MVSKSIIYPFKLHCFGNLIIKPLCSPIISKDTSHRKKMSLNRDDNTSQQDLSLDLWNLKKEP